MAFPSFVSASSVAQKTTNSTTMTGTLPASLVAGNILIAIAQFNNIAVNGQVGVNSGNGWNLGGQGTNGTQGTWAWAWKVSVGAGEVAVAWSWTTATTGETATFQVNNGGYGTPIGSVRVNSGTVASLTTTGITTTSPNSTVFAYWIDPVNTTTENIDNFTTITQNNNTNGSSMLSSLQEANQATTTPNAVISGTTGTNWAVLGLFEIRTQAASVNQTTAVSNVRVGSPVIGSPALGKVRALAVTAVRVGSPVLGPVALFKKQAVAITSVRVGSPVIGSPALGKVRALAVTAVRVGSPVIGSPALAEVRALAVTSVMVGSPVIGAPILTIANEKALAVSANLRVGSPVFDAPALTRLPTPVISPVRVGSPVIDSPFLAEVRALAATAVRLGSPVFGAPLLAKNLSIAAVRVGSPAFGAPLLAKNVFVAGNVRVGSPDIGSPILAKNLFVAANVRVGSPVFGSPLLAKNMLLDPVRVGSPILGAPLLEKNLFVAANVRVGSPIIGAPFLGKLRALANASIRIGSPIFGAPFLGKRWDLDADDVRTGSPVLGAPFLAHRRDLATDPFRVGSPIIGAPDLETIHNFHIDPFRVARPHIAAPFFIGGGPEFVAIGPFFFAWSTESEAFDSVFHAREDNDIFAFKISQQEGDFATLTLTVKNPRIGLLAPGRSIWCWFSWASPNSGVVPLFHGRLIGLPENLADEEVTLNFIARPSDYAAQKAALAATLRTGPLWDGIWFNDATRDDPDNVLEARPEAWHIDRVTHDVSTSNIVNGEDGTLEFDEDQVFYDSVKVGYAQNPLRTVQMTATVSWDQVGTGGVSPLKTGGLQGLSQIQSYTGEGLAAAWPKPGESIGGGWTWVTGGATATGTIDSALVGEIVYPANGGLSYYADGGFDASLGKWGEEFPGGPVIGWAYHVAIPNVTVSFGALSLAWQASRRKTEVLSFTLSADVQDIITLPDDGEVLALTMQSSEVTNAVDAGGLVPIRNPLARSYFNSDRGELSISFLIAVARAHLLARARAVNVSFEIAFDLAIDSIVSLRKNAVISDPRLPGTNVGGKLTAYELSLSGGTAKAALTMGCVIGKDGTNAEIVGTPDYVADGYVANGYQTRTGAYSLPFAEEDVAFESQHNVAPNDDGIDFLRNLAGHGISIGLINGNGATETQRDALGRFEIEVSNTGQVTAKNTRFAQLVATVPDLTGGPFQTNYNVNVTDLKIPRTINLEASSEGASSI